MPAAIAAIAGVSRVISYIKETERFSEESFENGTTNEDAKDSLTSPGYTSTADKKTDSACEELLFEYEPKRKALPSEILTFNCTCRSSQSIASCPEWNITTKAIQYFKSSENGLGICSSLLTLKANTTEVRWYNPGNASFNCRVKDNISRRLEVRFDPSGNQKPCLEDIDCYVKNQICQRVLSKGRKVCQCPKSHPIFHRVICYEGKGLGKTCEDNIQCNDNNSYCNHYNATKPICACYPNYLVKFDRCVKDVDQVGRKENQNFSNRNWKIAVVLGVVAFFLMYMCYYMAYKRRIKSRVPASPTYPRRIYPSAVNVFNIEVSLSAVGTFPHDLPPTYLDSVGMHTPQNLSEQAFSRPPPSYAEVQHGLRVLNGTQAST